MRTLPNAFIPLLGPLALSAAIILTICGAYVVFVQEGEQRADAGFLQRQLAERAFRKAIDDIPAELAGKRVALPMLAGDESGYLERVLRDRIRSSGRVRLAYAETHRKITYGSHAVGSLARALWFAKTLNTDLVLYGEATEFSSNNRGCRLTFDIHLAEVKHGKVVYSRGYNETLDGSIAPWRARAADSASSLRIWVWLGFAALLPMATSRLIRYFTAQNSVLINLSFLAVYTGFDIGFAVLLTGLWIVSAWTWILLLAALSISITYNYWIATLIENLAPLTPRVILKHGIMKDIASIERSRV